MHEEPANGETELGAHKTSSLLAFLTVAFGAARQHNCVEGKYLAKSWFDQGTRFVICGKSEVVAIFSHIDSPLHG
jgi:hypothetical protein